MAKYFNGREWIESRNGQIVTNHYGETDFHTTDLCDEKCVEIIERQAEAGDFYCQ